MGPVTNCPFSLVGRRGPHAPPLKLNSKCIFSMARTTTKRIEMITVKKIVPRGCNLHKSKMAAMKIGREAKFSFFHILSTKCHRNTIFASNYMFLRSINLMESTKNTLLVSKCLKMEEWCQIWLKSPKWHNVNWCTKSNFALNLPKPVISEPYMYSSNK